MFAFAVFRARSTPESNTRWFMAYEQLALIYNDFRVSYALRPKLACIGRENGQSFLPEFFVPSL